VDAGIRNFRELFFASKIPKKAHNLTKVRRYEKKIILQFTTKRKKKDFTYRFFFYIPKLKILNYDVA